MKAIIGKKVGMSQIFDENGHVIPVTVIEAGPCVVTQKKPTEKDGYEAVQLGYEDVAEKKLSKPEVGHLNKAGVSPKKYLREFALDNGSELAYFFMERNSVLLEANLILSKAPGVSFRALEDSMLIRVTREQLLHALEDNPMVLISLLSSVSNKFLDAMDALSLIHI